MELSEKMDAFWLDDKLSLLVTGFVSSWHATKVNALLNNVVSVLLDTVKSNSQPDNFIVFRKKMETEWVFCSCESK